MCVCAVFTSALACDGDVRFPDTPFDEAYDDPTIAVAVPPNAGETAGDSITPAATSDDFCLPFEISACHTVTNLVVSECDPADCACQVKRTHVDYASATAQCLNLACPRDYPSVSVLASCYQDWYLSIEPCLATTQCADWAEQCPDVGQFPGSSSCARVWVREKPARRPASAVM